jgi:solute carrier family 45, member 1/2/4
MFYSTLYIGDIYKRTHPPVSSSAADNTARNDEASRLATRAMFFHALLAFIGTLLLPFVAQSRKSQSSHETSEKAKFNLPDRYKIDLATLWAISHLLMAGCMFATWCGSSKEYYTFSSGLTIFDRFVNTLAGATIVVSITGLAGAIGAWVPYSIVSMFSFVHVFRIFQISGICFM